MITDHDTAQAPVPAANPAPRTSQPPPSLPPLLTALAAQAATRDGVAPEVATAAALAVAGAAAGGSVRFRAPDAGSVGTGLEVTLVDQGHMFLRNWVLGLAKPIEAAVVKAADKWGHIANGTALLTELRRQEKILTEALADRGEHRSVLKQGQACHQESASLDDTAAASRGLPLADAKVRAAAETIRSLRVAARPALLVQFLEDALDEKSDATSFDGSVFELRVVPSYLRRLARHTDKTLDRHAVARQTARWQTTVRSGGSLVDARPCLTSLWLADTAEARALWHDRKVAASGLLDGMMVIRSSPSANPAGSGPDTDHDAVTDAWYRHIEILFQARLDDNKRVLSSADDGYFRSARGKLAREAAQAEGAPPAAAELAAMLFAKLALNCALLRDPNAKAVETTDMVIAEWLTRILMFSTAEWRTEAARVDKSAHRQACEPPSKKLAGLLTKMERKGPMTRRDIVRSTNGSDYGEVDELLEEGIAEGLVEARGKAFVIAGR